MGQFSGPFMNAALLHTVLEHLAQFMSYRDSSFIPVRNANLWGNWAPCSLVNDAEPEEMILQLGPGNTE